MKTLRVGRTVMVLALAFVAVAVSGQDSDLCGEVDMKPVLSLQQVNQADLVSYITKLSGLPGAPSPEGKTPEQFYEEEVQFLIDNGFPPALADVEPDRLVTRRYFASVMYQVAVLTDPDFASQYGGLSSETDQLNALVESDWLYATEGRLYREELLSVLCNHILTPPAAGAIAISPERILEAVIEAPRSGI